MCFFLAIHKKTLPSIEAENIVIMITYLNYMNVISWNINLACSLGTVDILIN